MNVGQFDHPADWLSTNPFQYQASFKIGFGEEYLHGKKYADYSPSPMLRSKSGFSGQEETIIGNDVWVGFGAIIISGVTVGDGAIIGAGAVVTKDVEPYSIVGGVPATHTFRSEKEIRDALAELKWWEYSRGN